MSALLLYAIGERGGGQLRAAGIAGTPLREVAAGELAAIVSEHDRRPEIDAATLWDYERAVERLMAMRPILPARFPTILEDERGVETALRRRRREWHDALGRARGAVELAVRATVSGPHPAPPAGSPSMPGTAYLSARLELRRRARELAEALAGLDALARARRVRLLTRPRLALAGAYLVERGRVPDFTARVAELDAALPAVALLCTGPWPPYSFVGGAQG